jgi:F-type H+-transporting ATPase subunit b
MNFLWLVLQEHAPEAAQAAEHAATPNVFQWTQNVSFWTLVIFIILLGVLLKFAFPPILGYANAREQRIQDALDMAKTQRAEAEQLLAQQRQELLKARTDAQQLIAEGKQAAEKVRSELLNRAKAEQEELLARARAEIEAERARALESVRREAVDLALAAASKLVEQRLDADSDRRLVTQFLDRAGAAESAAGATR